MTVSSANFTFQNREIRNRDHSKDNVSVPSEGSSAAGFQEKLLNSESKHLGVLQGGSEGLTKAASEIRDMADRFDMTGVLGHGVGLMKDQIYSSPNKASFQDVANLELEFLDINESLESITLSTRVLDNEVRSQNSRSRYASKIVDVSKPKLESHSIAGASVKVASAMASALDAPIEMLDGAEISHRVEVKSSAKSILNMFSSQMHTSQLIVCLQNLEEGLRLFARVQNMTSSEQAKLVKSAKALLAEYGYSHADIFISETHIKDLQGRG